MRKSLLCLATIGLIAAPPTAMAKTSATQHVTSAVHTAKTSSKSTKPAKDVTVVKHAELSIRGFNRVHGTATLTLDETTHVLTVLVGASGLAPHSRHPEHIHNGAKGPIVYMLNTLVANSKGVAVETTVIKGVKSIASGWFVNIHQGPDLKGLHATVIAQGAVR